MVVDPGRLRAITLDLDDTLWPIEPVIARAEATLHAWLARHAPAVAERFDIQALRLLRDDVARDNPAWAHDFTRVRHVSIGLALQRCGHDAGLADAAFAAFFEARNTLEPYPGVPEALARLAARWPLLALTNGNADLSRLCLGVHFQGTVSARAFGIGKPDARIFHEALRRLGCAPADVLHVGDDWLLDVRGARAAGLHAAWVRHPHAPEPEEGTAGCVVVTGLPPLAEQLGV
jgi:FMN hydrolase / 5-amino-6-(5-phospho-D-ribitylamino)uracil phosphatase